jgi:sodium-dependent phosphate cotransporter
MYGASASVKYKSPLKAAIKPLTKSIQGIGTDVLGFEGTWAGIFMVIAAGIIIVGSLSMIVKTMNVLVEKHKGEIIEKLLAKNAYLTMAFGMLLTIAVQSSSITTSLLVPMAGAGVVSLRTVFSHYCWS